MPDNKPAAEITADAIAPGRGGFWRSLDELADTEAYRTFVEKEFPGKVEQVLRPDLYVAAGAAIRAAELPAMASTEGLELIVNAGEALTIHIRF